MKVTGDTFGFHSPVSRVLLVAPALRRALSRRAWVLNAFLPRVMATPHLLSEPDFCSGMGPNLSQLPSHLGTGGWLQPPLPQHLLDGQPQLGLDCLALRPGSCKNMRGSWSMASPLSRRSPKFIRIIAGVSASFLLPSNI